MIPVRFGTDGWRARLGREFTLTNLRRLMQAISAHHREAGARLAVVGYDRRFLAARFAREAAAVLMGNGLSVVMSDRPETTPATSCQVVGSEAQLGIVITASHNPPDFLGVKIKTAAGASAPPELTGAVEARLDADPVRSLSPEEGLRTGQLRILPFGPEHRARMARVVDLELLRAAGLRVVVDSMHGVGGHRVEQLLAGSSCRVTTLRGDADPLFGGQAPEPTRARLGPLLEAAGSGDFSLGFATDGDADRIAAVDETGTFLSPLRLIAVLALHLVRRRGVPGGIAKTFANTIYLDRIAAAEGRPFHCFPVGFKHVAALLQRGELAIGGEESGGIGFAGYLPERDGLLAGLLLMEAVAMSGSSPAVLVEELVREFGDYHYDRRDLPLGVGYSPARLAHLADSPPERVAGVQVESVDARDGVKLVLGEAGWLLLRPSGTEPVLRVYAESRTPEQVTALLDAGARLAGGD